MQIPFFYFFIFFNCAVFAAAPSDESPGGDDPSGTLRLRDHCSWKIASRQGPTLVVM